MSTEFVLGAGVCVCLCIYVLGAGADFGAGIWDLFASGPRKAEQRARIEAAMAPVWEANHVWLIFATVLLFAGFPRAFADIATALHVPLTFFLFGVVLRGAMFTFRHYDTKSHARAHGLVFVTASVVAPFWLGVCAAIISGPVPDATTAEWLTTFSVATGALVTSLFALLAAAYLAWEARDCAALAGDFRTRAYVALGAMISALGAALIASRTHAPAMLTSVTEKPASLAAVVAASLAVASLLHSLSASAWGRARASAIALATALVVGWASQRYPYLLEPRWTLASAAAKPVTQITLIVTSLAGACLLVPSLLLLFRVFKAK